MGKGKAKRGIPSKSEDFNAWYPFIVEASELVDKRYPIKGIDLLAKNNDARLKEINIIFWYIFFIIYFTIF